jgi:hypothetical protein
MRLRLAWIVLPFVLLAADDKKDGDKPPKSSPEAAETSPEPGVPAGAKKVGPYHWRYTDPQGKTWLYRSTPFGVARFPDEKPAPEEAPPSWKAVEVGDEIQFERPTPFGGMRWTKKKDQLTDLERKVWERDRPKAQPPAKPAEGKSTAKE